MPSDCADQHSHGKSCQALVGRWFLLGSSSTTPFTAQVPCCLSVLCPHSWGTWRPVGGSLFVGLVGRSICIATEPLSKSDAC